MASIKNQVSNGPRQEQVSAITGCRVGLTPPETTSIEFFNYVETTSQAALKKSLRRFMQ